MVRLLLVIKFKRTVAANHEGDLMSNAIEVIGKNKFKLSARGNEFVLEKKGDQWAVTVMNGMVKAYNRGFAVPKYFNSLQEVEDKYKSWKGITQLVEGLDKDNSSCN